MALARRRRHAGPPAPNATAVTSRRHTGRHGQVRAVRYYNCRNRLLFARKRFESRCGRLWWSGSIAYAWNVATRGSRRMLAKHPLLLWSAFRGTLAGAFGGFAPTARPR